MTDLFFRSRLMRKGILFVLLWGSCVILSANNPVHSIMTLLYKQQKDILGKKMARRMQEVRTNVLSSNIETKMENADTLSVLFVHDFHNSDYHEVWKYGNETFGYCFNFELQKAFVSDVWSDVVQQINAREQYPELPPNAPYTDNFYIDIFYVEFIKTENNSFYHTSESFTYDCLHNEIKGGLTYSKYGK